MLEKPDIQDSQIVACLRDDYGLNIAQVEFLPLGADRDTAVYRVSSNEATYFVKLRSGDFNEMTIIVPKLLGQGIPQVIAPFSTRLGKLWEDLGDFKLSVFPFIEGRDGYDTPLTDAHWVEFGQALKAIHKAHLPAQILNQIPRETFSGEFREKVRRFQAQIEAETFSDSVSAKLAALLRSKHDIVSELVNRAATFAAELDTHHREFVVCHADIHAWNLLIDTTGRLYIVDWDTLIIAPKERDLMFIGSGLFPESHSLEQQTDLFYQGYGFTFIDKTALRYYRCERIVQDIAVYCEEILLTEGESPDRENGLRQLTRQFNPGGVIPIALAE